MKKFKKILSASLLLALSSSAFAQIRSYVGIVRQQYFPEHIKYFENYRDELNEKGYSIYASYIDSYLKGGFGSGFVYVASDGSNYVITNRHVVSQAATASIEFENAETGKITKYENLSVLLTDDEVDIAILGFKDGSKPFKKGLTLSQNPISDGTEVWSAGFPGLGSDPVWQLGKGSVTNARARIKDLLDPSISTIIQHSAQLDGGNSGGPLMVSSKNGAAGYEVVGINTWKATWRDSTNFAIPVSQIQKMIQNLQKKSDSLTDSQKVSERMQKLAATLNDSASDFTAIAKYISYERASKQGQKDFEAVIHFAPTKVRNTVLDAFSHDPAEGLRYASAYQIWEKFSASKNDGKKYSAGEAKSKDGKITVDFTAEGENPDCVTLTWEKEHGLWRLSELSSDPKEDADSKKSSKKNKKSKKSGTSAKNSSDSNSGKTEKESSGGIFKNAEIESYDNIVLSAGADLSINGNPLAVRIGADVFGLDDDDKFGVSFMYHRESVDCFGEDIDFNAFGLGLAMRIPVRFESFGLNPYAKGCASLAFGDSRTLIGYTAEAGLQAMFNTDGEVHFGLGAALKTVHFSQFMDTDTDSMDRAKIDPFTNNCASLYAILSF